MRKFLLMLALSPTILQCAFAQTYWTGSGSNIYNSNSGNVGIGTTSPGSKLEVEGQIATNGGNIAIQNIEPELSFYNIAGATDEKYWDQYIGGGSLAFRIINDAFTASTTWMQVNRSGTTVNNIVFPNGNLGIGTTSPEGKLQIVGPLDIDGSQSTLNIGDSSPGTINVPVGTTTGGYNVDFHTWRDIVPDQIGARIRGERINNFAPGNALIQSMDLVFSTSYGGQGSDLTEKMRIKSSGNVGIGTTNPSNKLEVGSVATIYNGTQIALGDGAGNYAAFNAGGGYLDQYSFGGIHFDVNGVTTAATILSNGNVGIGTTSPDQMLTVNGIVHSQEVIVTAGSFPDYVFKPNYKLPALTEVKTYIRANHHLPEMPSADEVSASGLSLGDMNTKLLKKVEELTLYLIQQKETNDALQRQVENLNKKMSAIEKKQQSTKK